MDVCTDLLLGYDLSLIINLHIILTRSGFDAPDTVETGDSLHHTVALRIVQSGSFDLCEI